MRLQMYGNNTPTVADAVTHASCWASVRGPSLRAWAGPKILSLDLSFVAKSRLYLRVRGQCARDPLV